jgi:hypothetical protein
MRSMRATHARMYAANSYSCVFAEMYLRLGRLAYCSDSFWISCASRAISMRRWSVSASGTSGVGSACGDCCSLGTEYVDLRCVSRRVGVASDGFGAPSSSGTGAMPGVAFGTGLDIGCDGRCALSDSPPPLLFACAMKSAFSGFSLFADCTRITSSAGRRGGAFSNSKTTPSATTACATSENSSVTPSRSPLPTVASLIAPARRVRAGRTTCRRC